MKTLTKDTVIKHSGIYCRLTSLLLPNLGSLGQCVILVGQVGMTLVNRLSGDTDILDTVTLTDIARLPVVLS